MENYKVIENRNLIELQKSVNKLIEKGWIPIGGMTIHGPDFSVINMYYQTLIKKDIESFYSCKVYDEHFNNIIEYEKEFCNNLFN